MNSEDKTSAPLERNFKTIWGKTKKERRKEGSQLIHSKLKLNQVGERHLLCCRTH